MSKKEQDLLTTVLKKLAGIDYIKPEELPNIELYMDQVTTFMNTHLSDSKTPSDEKILTKTMINNYAKNNLLPPPVKKKYSKEHMVVLIYIYYFKSMLSINEIQSMLNPLSERFFDSDKINMTGIYKEIYASVKEQISTLYKDISIKQNVAKEHYNHVSNKEDRDFLQTFDLIGMLGFDIFLKKQIIKSLIHELNPDNVLTQRKAESKEPVRKEPIKKAAPPKEPPK